MHHAQQAAEPMHQCANASNTILVHVQQADIGMVPEIFVQNLQRRLHRVLDQSYYSVNCHFSAKLWQDHVIDTSLWCCAGHWQVHTRATGSTPILM